MTMPTPAPSAPVMNAVRPLLTQWLPSSVALVCSIEGPEPAPHSSAGSVMKKADRADTASPAHDSAFVPERRPDCESASKSGPPVILLLGGHAAALEQWLAENERKPRRERLTLIRLYEVLRGLGFESGYDAVRRHARRWQREEAGRTVTAFVPSSHETNIALFTDDWIYAS